MPLVLTAGRRAALAAIPLVALARPRRRAGPCRRVRPDNGGLSLPEGFCASVVASDVDDVRHLAVAPDGDLYAATGGGLLRGGRRGVPRSRRRRHHGRAGVASVPRGGNDVAVHDGLSLPRARADQRRPLALTPGKLEPAGDPETIVSGLPDGRRPRGQDVRLPGRRRDARQDRVGDQQLPASRTGARSPPAAIRAPSSSAAPGIWRFAAGRAGQRSRTAAAGPRALRNAEALGVQPGTGRGLGRDPWARSAGGQLGLQRRGQREQSRRGAGAGLGGRRHRLALLLLQQRREAEGARARVRRRRQDGRPLREGQGRRRSRSRATGRRWRSRSIRATRSGAAYTGGLFVTFHGSWNRAPLPQEGYRVVFAPFADGKPTGTLPDLRHARERAVSCRWGWRWARTGRCSSRTTTTARSGGS